MELFKLLGTIAINGTEQAKKDIGDVNDSAKESSSTLSNTLTKVGNATLALAKTVAVGVTATATAIGAITGKAVNAYGEYEQLVGGVETLYKESSDIVLQYAQNAYKTAGLSANKYMELTTSFTASLLQGLNGDTAKTAKVADMAITDMSDNVNKMGTSMEMVQNAYQGFSKNNYTMLDNLKLGFGGTKSEMERLLSEAEKLTGIKYDINNLADVYNAIHVIQQELGITGTTALEANTTIQGSMSSVKASWDNIMVALADDNQNLGDMIQIFTSNLVTMFENMLPKIETVFSKIPSFITNIAPILGEMVIKLLPTLLTSATTLIVNLIALIPGIFQKIWGILPQLVTIVENVFVNLIEQIASKFGITAFNDWKSIVDGVITLIEGLSVALVSFKVGSGINSAIQSFNAMKDGLLAWQMATRGTAVSTGLLNGELTIGQGLWALLTGQMTLSELATYAQAKAYTLLNTVMNANPIALVVTAIVALIGIFAIAYTKSETFRNFINKLWETIKEVFGNIPEVVSGAWETVKDFTINTWNSIVETLTSIWNNITNACNTAWETIKNVVQVAVLFIQSILNLAKDIFLIPWRFIWENFGSYLTNAWNKMKNTVNNALTNIKNVISNVMNTIKATFTSIWNSISSYISNIWNTIKTNIANYVNSVKITITNVFNNVKSTVTSIFNSIKATASSIWNSIKNTIVTPVNNAKNTVSSVFNSLRTSVSSVFNSIYSTASSIWNSIKNAITTPINSALSTVKSVINSIKSAFNFSWSLPKLKLPHLSITGGFSLVPPNVPKFSIEWYKKAMDNPMILDTPTIFGMKDGQFLGGGEAGEEVVSGKQTLMNMIKEAVGNNESSEILATLKTILKVLTDEDKIHEILVKALTDGSFAIVLDNREVGRIVRKYA
jgi:phage-related protein